MSVVFHVKLLNILGFVHLPEKVLDKYFEIKGRGGGGGGGGVEHLSDFLTSQFNN